MPFQFGRARRPANLTVSPEPASDMPPLDWEDGEPTFKLCIAGGTSSGKTVLLASLNDFLSTPNEVTHYHARLTSGAQEKYLTTKMNEIKVGTSWPMASAKETEYIFRCFYADANLKETFPLFKFKCVDYPGGYLTDPEYFNLKRLRDLAQESHIVIFLVDGQKILDAIEGRRIVGFSLDDELDVIAAFATECLFRPMQFVITKADLLKAFSLAEIRDMLLGNQKFAAVLNKRREAKRPTHLIPVSAVGDEFVDYKPESGNRSMIKRAQAIPRPYNIDAMLALVISDTLLNSFKDAIKTSDRMAIFILSCVIGFRPAVRFVADASTIILDDARAIGMLRLMERVAERADKSAKVRKSSIDKKIKAIKDKNSALTNIIEIQQLRVNEFLSKYIDADLMKESRPTHA